MEHLGQQFVSPTEALKELSEIVVYPTPESILRSRFGGGKIDRSSLNSLKRKLRAGWKVNGERPVLK